MSNASSKISEPLDTALYIVATPIGNVSDISSRAIDILRRVEVVLAEDTRHSGRLFKHLGISTPLRSCHDHNEGSQLEWLISMLDQGRAVALISDAGTPLISDPGYFLVRSLRERCYKVSPVPGASSIVAALCVSGLPTDSFVFDGFLPAKSSARKTKLASYTKEDRTIVLLESTHRIIASLADMETVLGADRVVVLARELTKKFETVLSGTIKELRQIVETDVHQQRGEFVLLIAGAELNTADQEEIDLGHALDVLMAELPLKQSAALAANIFGRRKNEVYQMALNAQNRKSTDNA